ncbi:GTP-binding protein Rhes-like, partial [Chiloscyllium plagiosum]|uniref:GTP-binding protein Rhes-like n=1 Tax=Chiloscyllium plagiosum TaxID=36176 RepID=UPI001CB80D9B
GKRVSGVCSSLSLPPGEAGFQCVQQLVCSPGGFPVCAAASPFPLGRRVSGVCSSLSLPPLAAGFRCVQQPLPSPRGSGFPVCAAASPFPQGKRVSGVCSSLCVPPAGFRCVQPPLPSPRLVLWPVTLSHSVSLSVPGDVFILVFSLDNRGSFDEVERLRRQIIECKTCLRDKAAAAAGPGPGPGPGVGPPMAVCGNKVDRAELHREVWAEEAERLVAGDANSVYFELSAKKNSNVEEMFRALFALAKLPDEMSPALHRRLSVQYPEALHRKSFRLRRGAKELGAFGMVSPLARRPSLNSDLRYLKEKVLGRGQGRQREKCLIQ